MQSNQYPNIQAVTSLNSLLYKPRCRKHVTGKTSHHPILILYHILHLMLWSPISYNDPFASVITNGECKMYTKHLTLDPGPLIIKVVLLMTLRILLFERNHFYIFFRRSVSGRRVSPFYYTRWDLCVRVYAPLTLASPLTRKQNSNREWPGSIWFKRRGHLNWRMGLPALLGGNLGCRIV